MEVLFYQAQTGTQTFREWLLGVRDLQAVNRIEARVARVAAGNLGDAEPVGAGVLELKVDWGPGYRVYVARLGQVLVLLLCGGDKRTQVRDIERAKGYFKDHKARTTRGKSRGSR